MKLFKKNVYRYILDLLMAETGASESSSDEKVVFDQLSLDLPNVNIEKKEIVITNYKDYETVIDERIEQIVNNIDHSLVEQVDESELETEYLKIKKLKEGYNMMKVYYLELMSIAEKICEHSNYELLLVEAMVKNKRTGQVSDFIAKNVCLNKLDDNLVMVVDDHPILILNPVFDLDLSQIDIKNFSYDSSEEFYAQVEDYIIDCQLDIELDIKAPKIILRKKVQSQLQSTVNDYQKLIVQTDADETLDEVDLVDQITIFESELDILNRSALDFYNVLPMNLEQMHISHFIKTESLAVEGPAGTGKTHSVINVVADFLAADKNILIASENYQTVETIYRMLPEQLQAFTIMNYTDSEFNFKQLESVLRNLIAKVDAVNVTEAETELSELNAKRKYLVSKLSAEKNNWIKRRKSTPEFLVIDGVEKSYVEWCQSIDYSKIVIEDCLIPELEITKEELENVRKLSQVKQLNHDVIDFEQLPKISEVKALCSLVKTFKGLDLQTMINVQIPKLDLDFLTYNCNQLIAYWIMSETEFKKDCADIKLLTELTKQKLKSIRELHDYSIELPVGSTVDDLESFLNDYYDEYKLYSYTKIKHHKLLKLKINGQPYHNFDDGLEILEKYLKQKKIEYQIESISDRFEHLIGQNLSINQLSKISNQFILVKEINNTFCERDIDLINICLETNINIFQTVSTLVEMKEIAQSINKIVNLINNTENASELQNAVRKFMYQLEAGADISFEYKKLTDLLVEQNQVHIANTHLNALFEKINVASPSLYQKIINKQFTASMLPYWRDNYIYTMLLANKIELKLESENELLRLNTELIEKKVWLSIASQITKDRRANIQVILSIINKLNNGVEEQRLLLKQSLDKHINQLFDIFPIWMSTRENLPKILNDTKNSKFDLVVYDECSESTIQGLNILARAKRNLLLGDYRQISPKIEIEAEVAKQIREKYKSTLTEIINHDTSLLSYAQSNFKTISLKKQFRSEPEVIEFSKSQFYNAKFDIAKIESLNEESKVESYYCDNTEYLENNTNPKEATEIVDYLQQVFNTQEHKNKSIGVISLAGQAQAELIKTKLYSKINIMGITNHLKFGSVLDFRNAEFDIVIISLVINNQKYLEEKGITDYQSLNLAMSRAKSKLVLFHSIRPNQISDYDNIYYKLISYFESKKFNRLTMTNNAIEVPPIFKKLITELNAQQFNCHIDSYNQDQDLELVVDNDDIKLIVIFNNHGSKTKIDEAYQQYRQYQQLGYSLLFLDILDIYADYAKTISRIKEHAKTSDSRF